MEVNVGLSTLGGPIYHVGLSNVEVKFYVEGGGEVIQLLGGVLIAGVRVRGTLSLLKFSLFACTLSEAVSLAASCEPGEAARNWLFGEISSSCDQSREESFRHFFGRETNQVEIPRYFGREKPGTARSCQCTSYILHDTW